MAARDATIQISFWNRDASTKSENSVDERFLLNLKTKIRSTSASQLEYLMVASELENMPWKHV